MEAIFSLIFLGLIILGAYVLFQMLVLFVKHPVTFIFMIVGLGFLFGEDDCEI